MSAIHFLVFLVFPLGMALAAASDLLTMTIPNRLVVALGGAFVILTPFTGMDLATFGFHVLAGGIVLAVAFFCFAMGWIGGGDAKLAAVTALWLGIGNLLAFLATASVLGGILTILLLSYRRAVLPGFVTRQAWLLRLHDEKAGVPYGLALAAAGLAVYPHTVWTALAAG